MQTTTQMDRITGLTERELRGYVAHQATEAELINYWGRYAPAVRELAREAETPRKRGDSLIILLPGLMGSSLEDRGNDPQLMWINPLAYIRGEINRLDMSEDGQTDAMPGVKIGASGLLWIVYARLLLGLQREYEIHSFSYDWRRFSWDMAPLLQEFIDQKLAASPFDHVTLVGHSLGGLLGIDYLTGPQTRAHAEKRVKRLITLGTPFRGALLAVRALARGEDPKLDLIKNLNARNDPLQMLRSLPVMYELLPAPRGCYPDGWNPVSEFELWDEQTWDHQGVTINKKHLMRSREHHEYLSQADPQVPVYCVVGALYKTMIALLGDLIKGTFEEGWEGAGSGDGTVATASAMFRQSPAYYVHEVHSELVLEKTVIDGIADWVDGGQPSRLVRRIEDVVRIDAPLRGALGIEAQELTVDPQTIRSKAITDQPLDHEELRALHPLL